MQACCLYACFSVSNPCNFLLQNVFFGSFLYLSCFSAQVATMISNCLLCQIWTVCSFLNSSYLDLLYLYNLIFPSNYHLYFEFRPNPLLTQPYITTKWIIQSFTHILNIIFFKKPNASFGLMPKLECQDWKNSLNTYYNIIIY